MTRPIAIALAAIIDEELANAVRSNRPGIKPKPKKMGFNGFPDFTYAPKALLLLGTDCTV